MRPAWSACLLSIVAIALTVSLAQPAHARLPATVETTVPDGGYGTVISPSLPSAATTATITMSSTKDEDAEVFDELTKILTSRPTRGARVVTCALIALNPYGDSPLDVDIVDGTLQALFLDVCIRMALALPTVQLRAAATPAGCRRTDKAVGVQITRSGGRYRAQVHGTTRKPRSRPSLVTSCRRKGSGLQLTLRPRSSRRTLRQVVGPRLSIGYVNPASAPRAVRVRTTFRAR